MAAQKPVVLITGAEGRIGSAIAAVLEDVHTVVGFERKCKGADCISADITADDHGCGAKGNHGHPEVQQLSRRATAAPGLEDELQHAGDDEQADQEDDCDDPEKDFHLNVSRWLEKRIADACCGVRYKNDNVRIEKFLRGLPHA